MAAAAREMNPKLRLLNIPTGWKLSQIERGFYYLQQESGGFMIELHRGSGGWTNQSPVFREEKDYMKQHRDVIGTVCRQMDNNGIDW
ncbi:MAG: hypothetical protein A3C90_04695 [Candidatus Magasanikbacteria bacterium RIFCSPHIGHO2_02_FULL_51_14]|uniref:Uncharacterized protein n=1 Tax=Candidatus Magasanikbacteria bacterium RIFCSPHIGHO2_02_FULL_51_14 TaxID=1798683 RepID=A0A1F6MHE5_9BACT|nr:MAG: hypothetical protein A3C90_04695 [Candidatus Magasanikbacteria bacterium RIFCSPHIGHO2_02_FULL_51_14]